MSKSSTFDEKAIKNTPKTAKVISITDSRRARIRALKLDEAELDYRAKIIAMDKLSLLQEMVNFQQERTQVGELTLSMMIRGKFLFNQLEINAETEELRTLARSYRRHLEHELSAAGGEKT
ncbi:MAG: hypothetical protein ACK5QT_06810 [Oligoflexia bacterium]